MRAKDACMCWSILLKFWTYSTRRKYCNRQGTHGFRLPIGTSTGTRLGTDHGTGYCSGLGFPYVFFVTCFVEPVSVCFRVSVPIYVHVSELRVRCSIGMIRVMIRV